MTRDRFEQQRGEEKGVDLRIILEFNSNRVVLSL